MNPCATEYIKQIPLLQLKQEGFLATRGYTQANYLVRGEFITMRNEIQTAAGMDKRVTRFWNFSILYKAC
jgi:hypothetical protein